MNRPDKEIWLEACQTEMGAMDKNQVYEVSDRPSCNVVGSRWIFTKKVLANGTTKAKARIVAKGFTQQFGHDYQSTFAPVIHMDALRFLFSMVVKEKLVITQVDIKTAFLNGVLDEVIFMEIPEGYDDPDGQVWRLKKSIYGLKQSPRCWSNTILEFLNIIGFTSSIVDTCILFRPAPFAIIACYVDDLLLLTKTKEVANQIISKLSERFELHILEAGKFLGLE